MANKIQTNGWKNLCKYLFSIYLQSSSKFSFTGVYFLSFKTKSIKYEHIEKLCDILECTPSDLFIKLPDPPDANKKTTKKKTVKSKKSKSKQTKNNNSENEQSQTENLKSDSETIDLNSKIES